MSYAMPHAQSLACQHLVVQTSVTGVFGVDRMYVPVITHLAVYVYPKLKAVSEESSVILSSAR